ncbi:MAG: phosphoribosylanthranilate isomerase [Alphaproteobacteria bacterium]|nr:phosphoribosylanthranilate isomerase [Alphaproteobacteria bacterium]
MRVRVKICCIQDEAELDAAIAAGADCVGFVGRGLSGPEVIDDDDRIGQLASRCPPGVDPWLLTREADPEALVAQVRRARVATVQLCDRVPPAAWAALRQHHPAVRIVQVVHVGGPEAEAEARAVAPHVDAVLLDSGAPAGDAPVYGGTGRTHDWAVSARVVRAVPCPVWLAGGLRASNVADAIAAVGPFGVDLCSGVRSGGRLDPEAALAFVRATGAG